MSKVSVIIPTFNNENEIERCIESILGQTYNDYEIIIVDDCSKDNTYQILIDKYSNNSNMKIFKNESNMKSAYTRNIAIKNAKGKYIAVQDADDYSSKDRLLKQTSFLDMHNEIDFVGSNASSFDKDGIWRRTNLKQDPELEDFMNSGPFVHASIMFRKSALNQVCGYRVSKEIERGQDYDLLIRLYKRGFKGHNLKDNLYFYQETIETMKKRNLINRYKSTKNKLNYFPWKELTMKQKIKIVRTVLIGFIPSSIWYRYLKKNKSRKS